MSPETYQKVHNQSKLFIPSNLQ